MLRSSHITEFNEIHLELRILLRVVWIIQLLRFKSMIRGKLLSDDHPPDELSFFHSLFLLQSGGSLLLLCAGAVLQLLLGCQQRRWLDPVSIINGVRLKH